MIKLSEPKRIQRKRIKGFKLPANTVCVNRGTKWGNPFKVGAIYENTAWLVANGYNYEEIKNGLFIKDNNMAVELYKVHLNSLLKREDISELRGKNLACFCKLEDVCHADILLKLANGK